MERLQEILRQAYQQGIINGREAVAISSAIAIAAREITESDRAYYGAFVHRLIVELASNSVDLMR